VSNIPQNQVALWAGVAAFFGSLLAIGIFDILQPDQWQEYLGSLIVAFITAGGVYAKQRLDDAKKARVHAGKIVVNEIGDKKMFSLELDGDPAELEHGNEVLFKVQKGPSE
jgi:hypothetical protein